MLTVNSAKELEHFERIRRKFESSESQKEQRASETQASLTIGDAINGLSLGSQSPENGVVANGSYQEGGSVKGKGKHAATAFRKNSTATITGKGKSRTVPIGGGDSDSSLDGFKPVLRNGNGVPHQYEDVGEDDDGAEDGIPDADDDDYVVRTDHLKTTNDGNDID